LLEENNIPIIEKELDVNSDGVNLMTAHKAKGLEFKYVFLIKCYDGNWGGNKKGESIKLPSMAREVEEKLGSGLDYGTEDERRLFYVALTRAKEQIYITYAQKYPSGNSTKEVSQSQFIGELDKNLVEFKDAKEVEQIDVESIKTNISPSSLSPYTIEESEFLKRIVKDFKMSATALNTYIECPKKFKFTNLLRVPLEYDKKLSLGTAVHNALEAFFR